MDKKALIEMLKRACIAYQVRPYGEPEWEETVLVVGDYDTGRFVFDKGGLLTEFHTERETEVITEKTAITPEEQAERVKNGHGWLLCDHCDNPATVHDTATDKYLCDEHSNTKAS